MISLRVHPKKSGIKQVCFCKSIQQNVVRIGVDRIDHIIVLLCDCSPLKCKKKRNLDQGQCIMKIIEAIYLSKTSVDLFYCVLCTHCMDILCYFQSEDLTMYSILVIDVTKLNKTLYALLFKLLHYIIISVLAECLLNI